MSSKVAISVDGLSKCYPIYHRPADRLKQFILPKVMRAIAREPSVYYKEFWALRDVSFEVEEGETVGIIGRNGSGKSTLLQIICGTLHPTQGSVRTTGRIGALLELGSGFNPEFTGRENVYMNGAILGLSKSEIDGCYDDIVDFADIGDFIEQPVKTYSSGMMVRLAFAVQAQMSPKILIVDEALAVGDAKFQVKCFERLKKLKSSGTSILLVTHSAEQIVMHCSKAILLEKGGIVKSGAPRDVVNTYMDLLFGREQSALPAPPSTPSSSIEVGDHCEAELPPLSLDQDLFFTRPGYNKHEYRWGDGAARILDFHLVTSDEQSPSAVDSGQTVSIWVSIQFVKSVFRPIFGFTVKTKEGVTVYGANTESLNLEEFAAIGEAGESVMLRAEFQCQLAAGDYFLSLGCASRDGESVIPHDRRYDCVHLQVRPNSSFFGLADLTLQLEIAKSFPKKICFSPTPTT